MVEQYDQRFGHAQGHRGDDELHALVCGTGRYTGDFFLDGQVHARFLRSPFANGAIRELNVTSARKLPGVLAVVTGDDLRHTGLGDLHCRLGLRNSDGSPMARTPRPLLARDRVRHVGELLAMVVATTGAQAEDAIQAIEASIEAEPAVSDMQAATEPDSPQLWPNAANNTGLHWQVGDTDAVARGLQQAHHITRMRLNNTRVVGNPMEPRSALAQFDPDGKHYTLITPSQGVHGLHQELAGVLDVAPDKLRVITPQVGGGFGIKTSPYPEQALVLWAAAELARPVKWEGGRPDSFLGDQHGRDSRVEGELALDADGRFLALRVDVMQNMGAYFSASGPVVPTLLLTGCLASVYRTPAICADVRCVFTHTVPTGPYRGAGRPEANYLVERLVEEAAREMGIDPVALRRRNFIPAEAMPYPTPLRQTYDSGDFDAVLRHALTLADWEGFGGRESESRARGLWRGRGLACFLETAGGMLDESASVHFTDDGLIELYSAAQSNGQGHTTSLALALGERLQVPLERVRVLQGDSERAPAGFVSVASRSMMMAGSAATTAADSILEKGRRLAAHLLEASAGDLTYANGEYRIAGTDRAIGLLTLAQRACSDGERPDGVPATLDTTETFTAPSETFPNGCHVCEVELDPETGVMRVVAYTGVDDCGRVIAPEIVHGQLHGGIAQGLGQVLGEHCVYDREGQLLTGSFMDYLLPRADDLPPLQTALHPVPCDTNPLGVKGTGEAGTVGAIPAAMNAIVDALNRAAGISRFDMPASPNRIWQALRETS